MGNNLNIAVWSDFVVDVTDSDDELKPLHELHLKILIRRVEFIKDSHLGQVELSFGYVFGQLDLSIFKELNGWPLRETFVRGSVLVEDGHQTLQIRVENLVHAVDPHILYPELGQPVFHIHFIVLVLLESL